MLAAIYDRYTAEAIDATLAEATCGTNTGSTEATLYPRNTANVNTSIGVFVVARHTTDAPASTEPWSRKHIRQ